MNGSCFIPFGAQYYRAPTPQKSEWAKDIENIRKHGFNTIKIWAQWRWNHPSEGQYYFDDLDQLMDLAHENGICVVINAIFDVAPAWFFRKYPESVMIMADGRRLEPQAAPYRQIGGTPGPCYHHKEAIQYKKRFLKALVNRYKDHPALYLWDLWNEPELTTGIKREPKIQDLVCYCPESVKSFIQWLNCRYGTIETLNAHWNRNYGCWEEVEVPRNSGTFNDMIDWRCFFADTLTEELRMRVEVVKQLDQKHPVMVHTVPMPHFSMITACSDDAALAEHCDMFGNSLGSDPFPATLCTSAAPGKKVINAEIHALGGDTYNHPKIPTFEEFKRHIMVPLSKGIKGFLFWQYRPEILGLESPAWGLTTLNGKETPWLDYSIKINNALQKYSEQISAVEAPPSEIAIINCHKNQIFDWCVSHNIDKHYHSVYGAFLAFYKHNYNVDIISTGQVNKESLARYKVIYYPFPYYMEDRVASVLKDWVESGGTLISEVFFGGIRESDGLYSTTMPGFEFEEVFGVEEGLTGTATTFINAYGNEWGKENLEANRIGLTLNKDLECISKDDKIWGYFFWEELISHRAEVIARFVDGKAAITCAQYGTGKAILIGTLLGYLNAKDAGLKNSSLICSLAVMGDVQPYVKVNADHIRADILKGRKGEILMVLVNNSKEEREVELEFRNGVQDVRKIKNIITEEEFFIQKTDSLSKCTVTITALGCEAFIAV